MIYIGIDFSINSTGICLFDESTKKFYWKSICSNVKINNKPFSHHKAISGFVDVQSYDRKVPKSTYSETNSYKLINAIELAEIIINLLKDFTKGREDQVKLAFEGFSYGSKGNSFIDLIMYNSICKRAIQAHYNSVDNKSFKIEVFSPSEVKKHFSGNGNAGKGLMIESFVKDKSMENDSLRIYTESLNLEANSKIPKPLDDLIDSYAIVKLLIERN